MSELVRQARLPNDNTFVDEGRRIIPAWREILSRVSPLTILTPELITELSKLLTTLKSGDQPLLNEDGTLNTYAVTSSVSLFNGDDLASKQEGDILISADVGLVANEESQISAPFRPLNHISNSYWPLNLVTAASAGANQPGVAYAVPIWIDGDVTVSKMGPLSQNSGLGARSGGIYKDKNGKPGDAVVLALNVSSFFLDGVPIFDLPPTLLKKGLYWLCFVGATLTGSGGTVWFSRVTTVNFYLGGEHSGVNILPYVGLTRSSPLADLSSDESGNPWVLTSDVTFPALFLK